ncbi:hypothetical protein KGF57_003363, partial [Candida theae]
MADDNDSTDLLHSTS